MLSLNYYIENKSKRKDILMCQMVTGWDKMTAQLIESKDVKKKLNVKLDKIDEVNKAIYDCKIRLNAIKPLNYSENETKEILIEILRNQAKINQVLRSTIKYVYRGTKWFIYW